MKSCPRTRSRYWVCSLASPDGVEVATLFGDVAEALLGDGALERAVGLQLEAGGAANGVEIRGKNRELDDLAVGAFHQDAVAALEVVLELAEGGLVPGGVEDEVSTTGLRGDDAAEFG